MPVFDIYDESTPRRVIIYADSVAIGRSVENDVIICEKLASRHHCEVRLDKDVDETQEQTEPPTPDMGDSKYDITFPTAEDTEVRIIIPEDYKDDTIHVPDGTEKEHDLMLRSPTPVPGIGKYYVLHDLQSRNGTILNEKRLKIPTPLANGDEINIGDSAIRFWINQASIPPHIPKLPIISIIRKPPPTT